MWINIFNDPPESHAGTSPLTCSWSRPGPIDLPKVPRRGAVFISIHRWHSCDLYDYTWIRVSTGLEQSYTRLEPARLCWNMLESCFCWKSKEIALKIEMFWRAWSELAWWGKVCTQWLCPVHNCYVQHFIACFSKCWIVQSRECQAGKIMENQFVLLRLLKLLWWDFYGFLLCSSLYILLLWESRSLPSSDSFHCHGMTVWQIMSELLAFTH